MEERREGSLEEGEARVSWAELGERVQETTLAFRWVWSPDPCAGGA